jgi:hypothetical protein
MRLAVELAGIDRRAPQAVMVAPAPRWVIEDDVGFDTLPGQWNKPVEVKA